MIKRSCRVLLLLFCCLGALPAWALETFTVVNETPKKVFIALSWYDDKSSRWNTQGWAAVERGGKTVYRLNSSADVLYYYAEEEADSKGRFSAWNGDGQQGSQWRLVSSAPFSYTEDQSCPPGNRRAVIFKELKYGSVKDYTLRLTKGR